MPKKLSADQRAVAEDAVFAYLKTFIATHGFAPSVKETASVLGVSGTTARSTIRALVTQGRIKRSTSSFRTITIAEP